MISLYLTPVWNSIEKRESGKWEFEIYWGGEIKFSTSVQKCVEKFTEGQKSYALFKKYIGNQAV